MMKVDLGIWRALTWVAIVASLVAGILLVAVWYVPLISQNERMRHRILKLTDDIQREEEISRTLKSSIDALQHDPKTVERLIREKLGYAKTDETVVRFEEPATNSAAH